MGGSIKNIFGGEIKSPVTITKQQKSVFFPARTFAHLAFSAAAILFRPAVDIFF
jgi:hypothetical protein